jgi:hypothetical protein
MSRVESVKSHEKKVWCRGEDVASAGLNRGRPSSGNAGGLPETRAAVLRTDGGAKLPSNPPTDTDSAWILRRFSSAKIIALAFGRSYEARRRVGNVLATNSAAAGHSVAAPAEP